MSYATPVFDPCLRTQTRHGLTWSNGLWPQVLHHEPLDEIDDVLWILLECRPQGTASCRCLLATSYASTFWKTRSWDTVQSRFHLWGFLLLQPICCQSLNNLCEVSQITSIGCPPEGVAPPDPAPLWTASASSESVSSNAGWLGFAFGAAFERGATGSGSLRLLTLVSSIIFCISWMLSGSIPAARAAETTLWSKEGKLTLKPESGCFVRLKADCRLGSGAFTSVVFSMFPPSKTASNCEDSFPTNISRRPIRPSSWCWNPETPTFPLGIERLATDIVVVLQGNWLHQVRS